MQTILWEISRGDFSQSLLPDDKLVSFNEWYDEQMNTAVAGNQLRRAVARACASDKPRPPTSLGGAVVGKTSPHEFLTPNSVGSEDGKSFDDDEDDRMDCTGIRPTARTPTSGTPAVETTTCDDVMNPDVQLLLRSWYRQLAGARPTGEQVVGYVDHLNALLLARRSNGSRNNRLGRPVTVADVEDWFRSTRAATVGYVRTWSCSGGGSSDDEDNDVEEEDGGEGERDNRSSPDAAPRRPKLQSKNVVYRFDPELGGDDDDVSDRMTSPRHPGPTATSAATDSFRQNQEMAGADRREPVETGSPSPGQQRRNADLEDFIDVGADGGGGIHHHAAGDDVDRRHVVTAIRSDAAVRRTDEKLCHRRRHHHRRTPSRSSSYCSGDGGRFSAPPPHPAPLPPPHPATADDSRTFFDVSVAAAAGLLPSLPTAAAAAGQLPAIPHHHPHHQPHHHPPHHSPHRPTHQRACATPPQLSHFRQQQHVMRLAAMSHALNLHYMQHPAAAAAYRHHLDAARLMAAAVSTGPGGGAGGSGSGGGGPAIGPYADPSSAGGGGMMTGCGRLSPADSGVGADGDRRKRSRVFIDPLTEIPRLERWFAEDTHPSAYMIEQFTDELNRSTYRQRFPPLEAKNVQLWFKNHRAKVKRQKLEIGSGGGGGGGGSVMVTS